jgi:hypothetical protein
MVLLDSNIFILDRFFPRDSLYAQNKSFVENLAAMDAAISSLTLLEICGAASFRLSTDELSAWLFGFGAIYPISVLDIHGLKTNDGEAWWSAFVEQVAANVAKKMTFGDAVLLREAECYQVEAVITWNTKDFVRRTPVNVLTPTAYLQRR